MDTPLRVTVEYKREQYEDGACTSSDALTILDARWSARGHAHYVTYEENVQERQLRTVTTLRLSEREVTLIRHGAIRWNHSFREGQKASSTMHVGSSAAAIETWTKTLKVNVTKDDGDIYIVYQMALSEVEQLVKLSIRFGE